jgi:hypothetical protein
MKAVVVSLRSVHCILLPEGPWWNSTLLEPYGTGDCLQDDKDKSATHKTLKEFSTCCLALCEVLHSDKPLDEMELLFIDNHLQVLQMAYVRWKRMAKKIV